MTYRVPSLWPSYIFERTTRFAKHMGLEWGAIGNFWGTIRNLVTLSFIGNYVHQILSFNIYTHIFSLKNYFTTVILELEGDEKRTSTRVKVRSLYSKKTPMGRIFFSYLFFWLILFFEKNWIWNWLFANEWELNTLRTRSGLYNTNFLKNQESIWFPLDKHLCEAIKHGNKKVS